MGNKEVGEVLRAFRKAKGYKSCASFAHQAIDDWWSEDVQQNLESGVTEFTRWHLDEIMVGKRRLLAKGDWWYQQFEAAMEGATPNLSALGETRGGVFYLNMARLKELGITQVVIAAAVLGVILSGVWFRLHYTWVSTSDPVWTYLSPGLGGGEEGYPWWVRLIINPGGFLYQKALLFSLEHFHGFWYERNQVETLRKLFPAKEGHEETPHRLTHRAMPGTLSGPPPCSYQVLPQT